MLPEELQALIDKWDREIPDDVPYFYHQEVKQLLADFHRVIADDLQKTGFIRDTWKALDNCIKAIKGDFSRMIPGIYSNFVSMIISLLRKIDPDSRLKESKDE